MKLKFITTKLAFQELLKRLFLRGKEKANLKTRQCKKNIADKCQHLIKAVDQPIINLV